MDREYRTTFETDCFDLEQIADSGQCFRMLRLEDGSYRCVAGNRLAVIRKINENRFEADCSREEFEEFWREYFDLGTDYGEFGRHIDPEDQYLKAAFIYGKGIRILRQDPWEMLITFIISQRKNIPAIRQAVEALCRRCGTLIDKENDVYGFPRPEQMKGLTVEDLNAMSMGYRSKYIYRAAADANAGVLDTEAWGALDDEALFKQLMSCYGVGIKVANCVELFGYHRIGAFPVDVWIDRIQKEYYGGRFPVERYSGYAGVMQQYMFYYERTRSE